MILAIFVILNPWCKIQLVEWSYKKIYGDYSSHVNKVRDNLFDLFEEYVKMVSPPSSISTAFDIQGIHQPSIKKGDKDLFKVINFFSPHYYCILYFIFGN